MKKYSVWWMALAAVGAGGCASPPKEEPSAPLNPVKSSAPPVSAPTPIAEANRPAGPASVPNNALPAPQAGKPNGISLVEATDKAKSPATAPSLFKSNMPVKKQDAIKTAVQTMMQKAAKAETLGEMAPFLTNETAARLGLRLAGFMAFPGRRPGMNQAQTPPTGGPPSDGSSQFAPLFAKYGLKSEASPQERQAEIKTLTPKGRQFLLDLSPIAQKSFSAGPPGQPGRPRVGENLRRMFKMAPNQYALVVDSPAKVYISPVGKPDPRAQHFEAHLEEGAWRIHLIPQARNGQGQGPGGWGRPSGGRRGFGGQQPNSPPPDGQRPEGGPGQEGRPDAPPPPNGAQ